MSGHEPSSPLSARRWGDLGVRAISAFVLVVVAVATALIGGLPFIVVWLGASVAVLWEWQTLIGGPLRGGRMLIGISTLLLVGVLVGLDHPGAALLLLIFVAAALSWLAVPGLRAWAAGGVLYSGLLLVAAIGLRRSPQDGSQAILWLFATVWSTDTFAYFGGRLIGGPKLAPRISPSKTWSGTLTGLTAGTLIGTLFALRGETVASTIMPVVIVTFLASALSQAGDAFESTMKRRFGVKDSGRVIPGHGGVMDRVDGFVTAAVFAFGVGIARDAHSVASGLFHWG